MDVAVVASLVIGSIGAVTGISSLVLQRRDKRENIAASPREFTVTAEPGSGIVYGTVRNRCLRVLKFDDRSVAVTLKWGDLDGFETSEPVHVDTLNGTSPTIRVDGRWDFSISALTIYEIVEGLVGDHSINTDRLPHSYLGGILYMRFQVTEDDTTRGSNWIDPPRTQRT